jgi:hypothetical protein
MTPVDLLRETGLLLYGPNWMGPMAKSLNVGVKQIQHWDSGRREFHLNGNIADRLVDLIDLRFIDLHKVRLQLFDPGDTVVTLASGKSSPPR